MADNPYVEAPKKHSVKGLLALVLVLILVLAAWTYFSGGFATIMQAGSSFFPQLKNANNKLEAGDFLGAAQDAAKIAAKSSDPVAVSVAHNTEAYGEIYADAEGNGSDIIETAKKDYMNNALPAGQHAAAVNRILAVIMTTRSKELTKQVFVGEPFQSYVVANDDLSSMRNLAQLSLNLYPSSSALFYEALWHTARINNFDKNYHATAKEKKAHAVEAAKVLKQADEVWVIEQRVATPATNWRFYFWRGFLYGVIATVDPKYIKDAEDSHKHVIKYFNDTRDASGNAIPLLENRMPYSYIAYAGFLENVGAGKRNDDIKKLLSDMMALIKKNPQLHEGGYVAVMRRVARDPVANKHAYKNYKDLVAIDPEFKVFLESYGVKF